ncbi:HAMP domain-containing sensor histidine kinase [Luteimonas sp. MJ250]|uniref:sensor histidine kinase n=1 Tax=Luteimonas sp. MJ250 TaxID=3129236 RepID=UPI0031BAE77B
MPRARAASLQQRVSLGVAAALALALGGLFLTLDLAVDREIYHRFDAGLSSRANAIATYLGAQVEGTRPIEQWMPEFREEGHTDFFQAWDAHGDVVARSRSMESGNLPRPDTNGATAATYFDLPLPDGHAGRAIARRYPLGPGDPRVALDLVVAEEREQLDALERRLHLMLAVAIGLALAMAMLLAASAASLGLRPLDQLVGRIATMRLREPRDRLDDGNLPRELAPVARRFDEVIDTLLGNLARERRFAQDLAHELRTPVAELRAITETSLMHDDPARLRQSLEELSRLGSEMDQTVAGLLALARHEAGLTVVQPEPLDLSDLVRTTCTRLAGRQAERGLACAPGLPAEAWVSADAAMSARLLAILLDNAIEHAPADSIVNVDLFAVPLRLVISNAAPALTPAMLPELGRRFFRADAVDAPDGRDSVHAGLGLALAHALASAQGLTLSFRLDKGRLGVEVAGWQGLEEPAV